MPRIKITNLKAGACVINSLHITLAGMGSIIMDSSVAGDPDLSELESLKIVSVQTIDDAQTVKPVTKQEPEKKVEPQKQAKEPYQEKGKKQGVAKQGKASKQPAQPIQTLKIKAGTDFRAVDVEDGMGAKVIIMGDSGPEVRKMGPGINGANGPKFVGDDAWNGETDETGFTTV